MKGISMWLLEAKVLERLEQARSVYSAEESAKADYAPHAGFATSGKEAVIEIAGILTKEPDPFIRFFYGANTAYDDIIAQLRAADADPRVDAIRFEVDSPGGNVDGMFDTLVAINNTQKPMRSVARNANSAAYSIAATAGPIEATSMGATFGSVGILASMAVSDHVVHITSSNAPDKAPDPRTEEGRAAIVRSLDATEGLMIDSIAEGRGVSPETVRANYGRGATLLAGEARDRGMIDGIAQNTLRVVSTPTQATADGGSEVSTMDLETLQAQHPAVYKAAVEQGVQQERSRAKAHLNMGEKAGALEIAVKAIREGSALDVELQSEYMAAAMNRSDLQARDTDTDVVDDATTDVDDNSKDRDKFGEAVVAAVEAAVGKAVA